MMKIGFVYIIICLISSVQAEMARKVVDLDMEDVPYEYQRPVTAIEEHSHTIRRLLDVPITGMNASCTTSLCEMMETALSCKGIGFDMSKTCAQYMLGFLYNCPNFPGPDEIFDAPYVCLTQLTRILPPGFAGGLTGGGGDMSFASLADSLTNVHNYMESNFTENCQRRCFQLHIEQANSFYGQCVDELMTWTTPSNNNNTRYPEVWILKGYQEFRNQVCAADTHGNNCFGKVQKFLPTYYGGSSAVVPDLNIFDTDCNYYDDVTKNQEGMEDICTEFQNFGCCFGNAVAMMAQSQTNATAVFNHNAIKMFPPCLLRYLKHTCGDADHGNALDPVEFCSAGANGNMTVLTGAVTMGARTNLNPGERKLVNVYDRESLIQFQGAMAFGQLVTSQTDKLTTAKALWVEVTDYAYYDSIIREQSESTMLTPTDGSYPTDQSDFTNAKSARIEFQFVLEGYDYHEAESFLHNMTTQYACAGIFSVLTLLYDDPSCVNVTTKPLFHRAEPYVLPPKSGGARSCSFSLMMTLLTVGLASVWQRQ